MGLTFRLGQVPLAIFTDSSNNVGIGAAANASYKLQVTGTTNLTGALTGTSITLTNALTALTLYSNAGLGLSLSGQFTGGGGYTGINGQALGIDIRPNSGGIFNLNFSSTTNRTFTFPDDSGTLVLGIGTTNYLPKFTGTSTIGNSIFTESGGNTLRIIATNAAVRLTGSNEYLLQTVDADGRFRIYDQTAAVERLTISSTGNLGLGVTPSAWATLVGFDIVEGGGAISSNQGGLYLTENAYFNAGWKYKSSTISSALYSQVLGVHAWYNAPSGTAGNAISFTQAMTLASTGNLLINTTTDAGYKLDVNGTGRFSGALTGLNVVSAGGAAIGSAALSARGDLAVTGKYYIWNAGITTAPYIMNNSNDITFYTNSGTNALSINSSAAATFSSSISFPNGAITSSGELTLGGSSPNIYTYGRYGGVNAGRIIFNNGTGANLFFGEVANNIYGFTAGGYNSTPGLTMDMVNYRLGIGTSSPTGRLTLQRSGNGAETDIDFLNEVGAGPKAKIRFGGTNEELSFWTGGTATERMRITSGGNVLINKTSARGNEYLGIESGGNEFCNFQSTGGVRAFRVNNVDVEGFNTAGTAIFVGKLNSTGRSINAGGTINALGTDYAEYMTKSITDIIEKGDIVGIDSNGLLTNIYNDSISFAVKSTNPSYVGGDVWGNEIDDETELEIARQKVDRIAFSGQVPCNVYNAKVGDYIIPIELNGKISGQAVTNPTFEQYQISVGKVWKIMEDGRAWIAVKIG